MKQAGDAHAISADSSGLATDRFQYGYDRDSNVLYKNNLVNPAFSELYHVNGVSENNSYDQLNRLTAFSRGTLSASGVNGAQLDTISSPSTANNWGLDALGNWNTSALSGSQSRSFNAKNQITSITGLTTPTYDNNGNMITDQNGLHEYYDAWNHLVQTKDAANSTILEKRNYDALGRVDSYSAVNTAYEFWFYSDRDQVIEEQAGPTYSQYVWSQGFQNAMILRDDNSVGGNLGKTGSGLGRRIYDQQDANYTTTSIMSQSGSTLQRFMCDAYGTSSVLTSTWGATTDAYGILYRFQGGRQIGPAGLIIFGTRLYRPDSGIWDQQDGGYGDGMNLYQFVGSDPVDRADPTGQAYVGIVDPNAHHGAGGHAFVVVNTPTGPVVYSFESGGWHGPTNLYAYIGGRPPDDDIYLQNLGDNVNDAALLEYLKSQTGKGKGKGYGEGGAICSTESAEAIAQASKSKALSDAINEFLSTDGVKGPTYLKEVLRPLNDSKTSEDFRIS